MLTTASEDPNVLAIKITLYRTGAKSSIVDALINAARNGKEVTVVVELRARFDEAANIRLATRLAEAGAKVAYGIVGHKCHAKMMMIVRREEGKIRRYVHLGTGNYHTNTSRLYTDFSYMTASPEIGEDVHNVFMQLTSLGAFNPSRRLLQSPFTLKPTLLSLIDAEIEAVQNGRKGLIQAKLNGLSEPEVIRALYKASQAGVTIKLVVRGICCLRPGVPNLSENITVRSILGRFLEHARVYHFHAEGADLVFTSSADWMDRNLKRRIEVATPITNANMKRRILAEAFDMAFQDNTHAWTLQPNGSYKRHKRKGVKPYHLQRALLDAHTR